MLNADYDQQLADQTEKAAEDAKKAEEQRLADLKEAYDEQTKLMANRVQLAETVFGSFTEALGGSMDDAGEAWRAGAKKILIGIADFLEQKLMAGGIASILEAIFNPLSTFKNAGLLLS